MRVMLVVCGLWLAAAASETPTGAWILNKVDENAYAAAAGHDACPLAELAEEFVDLRRSHILMFRHLDPTAWHQSGLVNNKPMSVRAMAFIMAGHVRHHTLILAERYGIRITSWPTPASRVNMEDS